MPGFVWFCDAVRSVPFLFLSFFFLFVFLGAISVSVENVQELMVAADMLQLIEVVSICGEFLKGHMDPFNCVGIFQFLEQIACMEMVEFTKNYIHVHFLEVWASSIHILSQGFLEKQHGQI